VLVKLSLIQANIIMLGGTLSQITLVLMFSQKNLLHPIIIKPQQFLDEINHIFTKIPNNLQVLINVNIDNINEIFKIIEIKNYFINDRLIFTIKLPLSNLNNYLIYHILPISIPINNHNQFIHLTNKVKYLITDNLISHYLVIENLDNCKYINKIFICINYKFLSNTETHPICDTELLNNHYKIPTICIRIILPK